MACFPNSWAASLVVLGFAAQVEAQTIEPPATANHDSMVQALLVAHNQERLKANLKPLALEKKLSAAAEGQADDMAVHRKMSHDGTDGSKFNERIAKQGYRSRTCAENVAYGSPEVEEVMRQWMESPHHKENILGGFTQVGFGLSEGQDGFTYWCADFGNPWPTIDQAKVVDDVLEALNKERAAAGQPKLVKNAKLVKVAAWGVEKLAKGDGDKPAQISGEDVLAELKKVGYRYQLLGESSSSGQPTATEAVKSWLESPAHKDNILGKFTEVGVGHATSNAGFPYWFLILAKPLKR